MSKLLLYACLVIVYASTASSDEDQGSSSSSPWCGDPPAGPWSVLLEDWAVGTGEHRKERILQAPNTNGYYISNRADTSSSTPATTKWSQEYNGPGKIANRPSQYTQYPAQSGNLGYGPTHEALAVPGGQRKEVSETDLYLLGAIEKLVYRVDFMEKRLKKTEELVYYLMAGNKKSPEPCTKNFTRVGLNCYHFGISRQLDWKAASEACKGLGATLGEMESIEENQDVVTYIQANKPLRGKDFWTGGLNPGLLWIWSNSARPVSQSGSKNQTLAAPAIQGSGRCLKLAYNPTIRSYYYLGSDCAGKQSYICEILDKTLSNNINRIARELNLDFN